MDGVKNFINSTYDQPIFDVVLSLSCFNKNQFLASGTGVIIAPYLAITAKHVIEDFIKRFESINLYKQVGNETNKTVEAYLDIVGCQYRDKGTKVNLWRAQQIYICLQTDIAFIYLQPFNNEANSFTEWEKCKIDLHPPKIGKTVFTFGFHSSSLDLETRIKNVTTLNWKDQPATSIGKVIEIHKLRRDISRINFPSFQTNARFDGGMSGGPVFNEEGALCGLVCSSLEAMNDSEDHISYVALIWPSLITQLSIPYPELINEIPYPALRLAEIGGMIAAGYEKINLSKQPSDSWYTGISFNYD